MTEASSFRAGRLPAGKVRRLLRHWKNQFRCASFNRAAAKSCRVRYADERFRFEYREFTVEFYDDCLFDMGVATPGYLAQHALQPGEIVVDGGAYIGSFAIVAAKLVTERGHVIAFEPDSVNHARLLKNIELNGLGNVTVVNKALWDQTEGLRFSDEHHGGSAIMHASGPGGVAIEATSLDVEVASLGLSKVDFVKMDIEGAELRAVQGCRQLMARSRPHFAIASYHMVEGRHTCHALEAWFAAHGYKAHTGVPRHLTTYARAM